MRFALLIAIVGCSSTKSSPDGGPFCLDQPLPAGAQDCRDPTATDCCFTCRAPVPPTTPGGWFPPLDPNCEPHCPAFPDAGLANCFDLTCDSAQVMSHTECLYCYQSAYRHGYCCQSASNPELGLICFGDPPDAGGPPDAGD